MNTTKCSYTFWLKHLDIRSEVLLKSKPSETFFFFLLCMNWMHTHTEGDLELKWPVNNKAKMHGSCSLFCLFLLNCVSCLPHRENDKVLDLQKRQSAFLIFPFSHFQDALCHCVTNHIIHNTQITLIVVKCSLCSCCIPVWTLKHLPHWLVIYKSVGLSVDRLIPLNEHELGILSVQ